MSTQRPDLASCCFCRTFGALLAEQAVFSLGIFFFFASGSLSCLWLWRTQVMYNKFFTLSLLRQPCLQLKTDRERRDRGKIHKEAEKRGAKARFSEGNREI